MYQPQYPNLNQGRNYAASQGRNGNNQQNSSSQNPINQLFQNQSSNPQSRAGQNLNTISNQMQLNRQHGAQPSTYAPLHQGQYFNKRSGLEDSLQSNARNGFIRKVYTLLTLQLLLTVGIGFWAFNSDTFKTIFVNIPAITILSVLLMAMSCAIGCCSQTFRKFALPFFIVFTLVFALLIGVSICGYKSKVIFMAAALTLFLVAALTIYACVTKSDLTGCGVYLFILSMVMLVFGIVCIFWRDPIVQLIYSCLSALLFSVYLVFDTQLVIGKGQNSYTLDDAYLAAIQLYIDVIELFLNLLRIISYFQN